MGTRTLLGCIAALAVLLAVGLLTTLLGPRVNQAIDTGLGSIALVDLLATFVAMVAGGWIARRNFRWLAVALNAISWIAILAVLLLAADATSPPAMQSLPALLQYNGLAILLSLVFAWLGAALGERLADRRAAAHTL
jgi:hypothetical protein